MYATHRTENSAHRLHTVLLCEYVVGMNKYETVRDVGPVGHNRRK